MTRADSMILAYARQQGKLTEDLKQKIAGVWELLDVRDLDVTYPVFEAAVMEVIQASAFSQYNLESVFFHAYVAEKFDLETDFKDSFYDYMTPEQSVALRKSIESVSIAPIKKATGQGISPELAGQNALKRVQGAGQRHALEPARKATVERSRRTSGLGYWQRKVVGETCAFCTALEARGAVYKADSARFAAHDDCDCVAVPSNGGTEVSVEAYKVSARNGKMSDADRERVKEWVAEYK